MKPATIGALSGETVSLAGTHYSVGHPMIRALDAAARRAGVSRAVYVTQLVSDALRDSEDQPAEATR